jgi:hypothetical protein
MVVIFLPAAAETGVTQERMGVPSRCTVQAPQRAIPQPYLMPVRRRSSRITQSNGRSGLTSTRCDFPFTTSVIIEVLLTVAVDRRRSGRSVAPGPRLGIVRAKWAL